MTQFQIAILLSFWSSLPDPEQKPNLKKAIFSAE